MKINGITYQIVGENLLTDSAQSGAKIVELQVMGKSGKLLAPVYVCKIDANGNIGKVTRWF